MATSQEWSCTNKIQITKVDGVKLMAAETPKQVHDKDGNAISKVVTKGGDLVYAKDHAYGDYEYKNSSTHACTCANCGNELTASHTTNSYQSTGSSYHLAYCDTCGHTWGSNISHSKSYSSNGSSTHTVKCSKCGYSSSESHSFGSGSLKSDSSGHWYESTCSTCGYTKAGSASSHSWSYVCRLSGAGYSNYHEVVCSACGYSGGTQDCTPYLDENDTCKLCGSTWR